MKKILISGYYGFGNFGDELILSILVNKLKSITSDITVLTSNQEYTKSIMNVDTAASFDFKKLPQIIKNTDILISGGGSLLQDATSLKSLVYYLGIIFLAQFFKKKVIIFAQGIGPINNKFARFFVLKLLKKCDYISVRDKESFDFLNSNNVKSDIVCDPAFSLSINKRNNSGKVGVQLRKFNNVDDEFLTKLAQSILNCFPQKEIEIFSLQNSLDYDICCKFQDILKKLNPQVISKIISTKYLSEIILKLSDLEYLVSMRFHSIVVALKSGVKTLCVNYDPKIKKLSDEFELPIVNISLTENFESAFNELLSEKPQKYCDDCVFDWDNFLKNI